MNEHGCNLSLTNQMVQTAHCIIDVNQSDLQKCITNTSQNKWTAAVLLKCVCVCVCEASCLTDCGKTHLSILTSSCAPGREEKGNGPLWMNWNQAEHYRYSVNVFPTVWNTSFKTTTLTGSVCRTKHYGQPSVRDLRPVHCMDMEMSVCVSLCMCVCAWECVW